MYMHYEEDKCFGKLPGCWEWFINDISQICFVQPSNSPPPKKKKKNLNLNLKKIKNHAQIQLN